MSDQIKELVKDNTDYFQGKKMKFINRASFFQCIADPDPDPDRAGGFIAAQQRPKDNDCD